jgi:hypothetical protein
MQTTELKHWYSGHTVHGKHFHQYALRIGRLGVLIAPTGKPIIKLFWLI